MTWKHPSSPVTKKFKVSHSAGNVMLTVFWIAKVVILIDFFISGTINAAHYCDTLTKLKSAIRRKKPAFLSGGVLFLGDNPRPNAARDTKEHIRRLGWERLDYLGYSLDLAHQNFPSYCIEVSSVGKSVPKQ
ncbi:hypothetical protein AVEN_210245-1 [Araneus ventricosus]|uniref:Tc1-like transposase DDE domain-containing protein n=1 Tax=Araneus ventricosus TaxID=182803 RepID=A0A4Y2FYR2_ARAVE|nr:hypothetical protein AVEN_210245-1 [Araneus ventricosus]